MSPEADLSDMMRLVRFVASFFHKLNIGERIFNLYGLIMMEKIQRRDKVEKEIGVYTWKKNRVLKS